MALTNPTSDLVAMARGDGAESVDLFQLSEPVTIPELNTQVTETLYEMRPNASRAGNRVLSLYEGNVNRSEPITLDIPYLTVADANKIVSWKARRPPTVQVSFDGGTTTYFAALLEAVPMNYPLNQREFRKMKVVIRVLGVL